MILCDEEERPDGGGTFAVIDYQSLLSGKIQEVKPLRHPPLFRYRPTRWRTSSPSPSASRIFPPLACPRGGHRFPAEGEDLVHPNRGFSELRKEISRYFARRFGACSIPLDSDVLVTVGGSGGHRSVYPRAGQPRREVLIPSRALLSVTSL